MDNYIIHLHVYISMQVPIIHYMEWSIVPVLNIQYMYLSSIVEKEASSAICVLSISWSETLLTYQCSLLVSQTLAVGRDNS